MKTHPEEGDESDFTSNRFEDESPSEGIKAVAPEENTLPGWPLPPPTNDNLEATAPPPYNKVYPPPKGWDNIEPLKTSPTGSDKVLTSMQK